MTPQPKVLQHARERRQPLGFSLGGYLRGMDWILLAATLALVTFGLFVLYSATHADTNISTPFYYLRSQGVGVVIGLFLLLMTSIGNYRWLARWRTYIYLATLALLVLTLFAGSGSEQVGANRWIQLPFFRLQTSEVAKLLLILSLAGVLAEGVALRHRLRFVILCVVYVLIPTALVFLQPDLGTALVFGAILATMLVVWGIRLPHLGALAGAGRPRRGDGASGAAKRVRRAPAQGLSVAAAHSFPRSAEGPRRPRLPAVPEQDRHRQRHVHGEGLSCTARRPT